jgi:DNA polymerase-3 subunit chi
LTQIGFYILEGGEALALACRLTEKAYRQRRRVYIHAPDEQVQSQLDQLLWAFRPGSFVAHARADDDDGAPVLIGTGEPPPGADDVMINLAPEVPTFFSRFQRLAELVPADPGERSQARTRYKFYQDRGYELQTHKISL